MKFVFYANSASPHQFPLARALVGRLGDSEYRYIYTNALTDERRRLGWGDLNAKWIVFKADVPDKCREWLDECDVLMSNLRDLSLFERRTKAGRKTIYTSERWFKPRLGILRLLIPSYWKMARRIVSLLESSRNFFYFPMGVHAARDMARLCELMHGDVRCMFRAPKLEFEKKPGGRIWIKDGADNERYCLGKMRMWGYYVEPSKVKGVRDALPTTNHHTLTTIKVLWVGRILDWKRVDTIVRAVGELSRASSNSNFHIQLDIYGTGPDEKRLKKLAAKYGDIIKFFPPVPIADVRKLMHEHDIYVLASNAYEGWGAVVSEALEEGMKVLGTYEAGSSATILPEANLFNSGDWRRLYRLLQGQVASCGIGDWSAEYAAKSLLEFMI